MRKLSMLNWVFILALAVLLGLGRNSTAMASAPPVGIQFKAGEMELLAFLDQVSEKLDLQIDASSLGSGKLDPLKVTVPEAGLLSSERAQAFVLSILYLQGLTWIHDEATDVYRVVRQRDARDLEIPLITDKEHLPDSDQVVSYVMKIEYTSPEFIARAIRGFMPAAARIIPDIGSKTVMISDSAHNVAKLENLVRRLDTPAVAKEADEALAARAKKAEVICPSHSAESRLPQLWVLVGLFSLIAAVVGFLARGYVIRRIEGGL